MNVVLPNGKEVRGDLIESVELRSDLVPIPETLEVTLNYDKNLADILKEGESVRSGYDQSLYKIKKITKNQQGIGARGSRSTGIIHFIALLEPVFELSHLLNKAVIRDASTLGSLYRACGSQANVESDIVCGRFTCFISNCPTYPLQQAMQEQAATVIWTGKALKFMRLTDLFKQTPAKRLATDTTHAIDSGFLERHLVPANFSTNLSDGGLAAGDVSKVRTLNFVPRMNVQSLRNMTQVLINRRTLTGSLTPSLKAGNVIEVAGKPYVIITVSHLYSAKTQLTKAWLGDLG